MSETSRKVMVTLPNEIYELLKRNSTHTGLSTAGLIRAFLIAHVGELAGMDNHFAGRPTDFEKELHRDTVKRMAEAWNKQIPSMIEKLRHRALAELEAQE